MDALEGDALVGKSISGGALVGGAGTALAASTLRGGGIALVGTAAGTAAPFPPTDPAGRLLTAEPEAGGGGGGGGDLAAGATGAPAGGLAVRCHGGVT